jgi:hypothetical protein
MLHELKTHPQYFKRVFEGSKNFEVRKNDRDFQIGDTLKLAEWEPENEQYTGRVIFKYVTYILHGGQFGIESGHCVMGLQNVNN